jgi:hypothetical protein
VLSKGIPAISKPELQHLKDQDVFTATIEMKMPDGSFLRRYPPPGQLPVPQTIFAAYRLHHQTECVRIAAYQMGNAINAFSGVSSIDGKQLTLVTKLQADGSRDLTISFADATPKRTRIHRLVDSDERGSKDTGE